MKRQKSILSYLKEPAQSSDDKMKGIDAPPQKFRRTMFPETGSSVFSSIRHKFARVEPVINDTSVVRSNAGSITTTKSPPFKCGGTDGYGCPASVKDNAQNLVKNNSRIINSEEGTVLENLEYDISMPETPGMRPFVPGLKRIQKDVCRDAKHTEVLLHDNVKKGALVSNALKRSMDLDSEVISKFEWLHPSVIMDAKRRRSDDPLYDRKTLYVPPDALRKMTASQRQYWDVKRNYMDVVLFFKVGKFYELYELDAEIGHKELDWKITLSGVGKCRQVGVSESGIDDAVEKLLIRGYKVGRMEQLETSEQAKSRGAGSVIQRKLINVLTPSTNHQSSIGPDAVHLLSIKEDCSNMNNSTTFGFAFVDCAALKFWVGSIIDDASFSALGSLLAQVSPKEIIFENQGLSKDTHRFLKMYNLTGSASSHLNPSDAYGEASEISYMIESNKYFVGSCDSWHHIFYGITQHDLALCALGGLISHLSRLMLNDLIRNSDISPYEVFRGSLRMDGQTLTNLEIFNNNFDGGSSGTLYKYLDTCITPFGKRLLRNWICHPLQDVEKINNRLAVVEELMTSSETTMNISRSLRKLPDLERLLGRIKSTFQSSSLLFLPLIGKRILKQRVKIFGSLVKGMRVGINMLLFLQTHRVMASLSKFFTFPSLTGNGGLDNSLAQFEAAVDSDFSNYQDHDVVDGDVDTLSRLIELFLDSTTQWSQVIHAIGCIDVLRSFASTAASSLGGAMCRPRVLASSEIVEATSPVLQMKGLWHPYVFTDDGVLPVPNDIHLGGDGSSSYAASSLLLTGPNMGGKSTLLRATCLTVILAQLGSYVPCEACTLSVVDIIFTRLGATDRIMAGESTFLVECTETSSILKHATRNSLVLLDELGRGTSTFDGYAIAYAVLRHLVESVNCRLLFATHYHSLTEEFASHPRVKLQHMAHCFEGSEDGGGPKNEKKKKLVFLYRLASGASPESYGMEIARMAGIPECVIGAASGAAQAMKGVVGESFFRSREEREEGFSSLHEEWVKSLVSISTLPPPENDAGEEEEEEDDDDDDDVLDSLYCLWHEVRRSVLMR